MVYSGLAPSSPANRSVHKTTDKTVDRIKVAMARFFHPLPHKLPWEGASHQPRASISTLTAKNGQVSACNAGAMASPADVPPRIPSKPVTTHHQGRGRSPLSRLTKGFSTCSNLIISPNRSSASNRTWQLLQIRRFPCCRYIVELDAVHRPEGGLNPGVLKGFFLAPRPHNVFSISARNTSYGVGPASR